ncbi:MAG: recombination regulator RecX [Clostridia bacterium]|nr:recombination regulator RecX [Clostridia bacterium]
MKISYSIGKQNKIHISCDDEYRFTVDSEFWFSSPYCMKHNIEDEQELAEFFLSVGSRFAFLAGLRLLSYSDHSKKEMISKLVQKGHKKEYVIPAIDRLEELGYVDDERYAENLARKLSEHKGMSARGIKNEIIMKGISREIAENICESLDFDPVLRIIELLNTKYSRFLADEKGRKKAVASLQRLGYGWSDINSAFRSIELETEDFDDV